MTTTVCTTFQSYQPNMNYTRNSNQAGSPLPSIPRRTSSSRTFTTAQMSEPVLNTVAGSITPVKVIMTPPTPPQDALPKTTSSSRNSASGSDSGSSDGSQPTIVLRSKRVRGQRSPPRSNDHLSPNSPVPMSSRPDSSTITSMSIVTSAPSIPPVRPAFTQTQSSSSSVGQLRLTAELMQRSVSESHIDSLAEPTIPVRQVSVSFIHSPPTTLVRTKSGVPVKSSLKSAKRPGLTVITNGGVSKSEPNTPTLKSVHFNAHLEHVKLFLAEQKPTAVSRDGSPTDDTSGTESDFPSFIYGGRRAPEEKTKLSMQVTNMPKQIKADVDVALEGLTLSQDGQSILGRVRVRNIAFEKWLAVRFTFDGWQTTSEVTAKYAESTPAGRYDIFSFVIRLNDIMARIEEKVLLLALRYTVAGREIWDNNSGANYLAKFIKTKIAPTPTPAPAPASVPKRALLKPVSDDEELTSDASVVNLKSKLEKVAQAGESFLLQRGAKSSKSEGQKPAVIIADKGLSGRYDFSASLKNNSWNSGPLSPPRHSRTNTYPSSPNTVPFPAKAPSVVSNFHLVPRSPRTSALGSPGLDEALRQRAQEMDDDDAPFKVPVLKNRNHQRGYFDMSTPSMSAVKKTPPGSPINLSPIENHSSLPRTNSFPPSNALRADSPFASTPIASFHLVSTGGSEDSTPSISSPSSSSRSSSPSFSDGPQSPGGGSEHYSSFLDRFCFYTGGESQPRLAMPVQEIPRSHSASNIEAFLQQSLPTYAFSSSASPHATPTRRSPSFDEVAYRSGSTTPTVNSIIPSQSRSQTPLMD